MRYKITIRELEPVDGKTYTNEKDVYEQTVTELDLLSVIKAINKIE